MPKEKTMFPEVDGALAKACDAYIDARDEASKAKESLKDCGAILAEHIKASGRKTVKHNGRVFSLREVEAKLVIKVSEP